MSNWLTKAVRTTLQVFRHGGASTFWGAHLARTRYDYRREVGDCLDTSVVMAPVQWVQRALPEATLKLRRKNAKGDSDEVEMHPVLDLFQKPNPFYGDIVLWWGVVLSLLTDGNAYLMIVRNGVGRPAELWYIPHWMMEPKWPMDGSAFLSHYRYSPGGGAAPADIDPVDVIHFRYGINPRNMRKGLAPIDSTIREIFMDMESSNFVSALLRNMGVPGVVISPKGGAMPNPQDVAATKSWFQEQFSGDKRGAPLVMGAPTDVTPYGFNPQQMNMSEARDVAEERVCASIGIPAAVVGFGAGLQSTKVGATMGEMRKLAWENGVLPLANLIADELNRSLLPLFPNSAGLSAWWDASKVSAMQEDEDKKFERWDRAVRGGWAQVYEGREACGLDADDSHRFYLRPIASIEVAADGTRMVPALPAPLTDGSLPGLPPVRPKAGSAKGKKARASAAGYARASAYALMLQQAESGLQQIFERPLKGLFEGMGRSASDAATRALAREGEPGKSRAEKSDELVIAAILDELGIPRWQSELGQLYQAHFLEVAKAMADAGELAGLGASLPDEVAQSIIAAGGRRSGLIDLAGQTRSAVFEALAEGRAAGEGAAQLAARIATHVEGGPWLSAETRARIIARTETKFAQNVSTVQRGRAAGVEQFVVFDGRLGPGRSLLTHMARDGSIVTADEAIAMAAAEHPNGTLSFGPYFGEEE